MDMKNGAAMAGAKFRKVVDAVAGHVIKNPDKSLAIQTFSQELDCHPMYIKKVFELLKITCMLRTEYFLRHSTGGCSAVLVGPKAHREDLYSKLFPGETLCVRCYEAVESFSDVELETLYFGRKC